MFESFQQKKFICGRLVLLYNEEWWLDRSVSFKEFVARQQPDQMGIMHYHKTILPFVPEALQARIGSTASLTNIPLKPQVLHQLNYPLKALCFIFIVQTTR